MSKKAAIPFRKTMEPIFEDGVTFPSAFYESSVKAGGEETKITVYNVIAFVNDEPSLVEEHFSYVTETNGNRELALIQLTMLVCKRINETHPPTGRMAHWTKEGDLLTYPYVVECNPIIALPLNNKWRDVYLIHASGDVETVPSDVVLSYSGPGHEWVDNLYHPDLLIKVAEYYGTGVCELSLELAQARWAAERE